MAKREIYVVFVACVSTYAVGFIIGNLCYPQLVGKALELIHHSMTILNLVLSCKIVTNF
jgi:hypothetical protein